MKTHFITYSDENYMVQQNQLCNHATHKFDFIHPYTKEWLNKTDFYLENKEILDENRGSGYWLWKPHIILTTLNKIDDGDIILYMDCGDVFTDGLSDLLISYYNNTDNTELLMAGKNQQKIYTKRDCFIMMDCDNERYHKQIQLEAGAVSFKNCEKSRSVVNEWLTFCQNKNIITDISNICGENLDGFIDHRHDQSVLTNITTKYNLNNNNLLRKHITCNVN